ncbi:MAG: PEP-CTERM sorting domain-containing protein [Burkholderiales bacterium]|jgi:hypothetical protein|nr:PEP-CTERM sorting domain-containing protein [Burkholderiales bacterium]
MNPIKQSLAAAAFGVTALLASASAFAAVATVDKPLKDFSGACESGGCGWSVAINGVELGSGQIGIDPSNGDISTAARSWRWDDGGSMVYLTGLSGNVDPFLVFGGGALNNSAADMTFAFTFSMPLIPALPVPINTFSEMGITLTPPPNAFAQVYATSSGGHIMEAQDIDILPSGARVRVNKGVDLFDESMLYTATGDGNPMTGDTQFFFQSASGSILSGGPYDIMVVTVQFGLTPGAGVGFSGKVEQIPVPEPSTYAMLGIGLATLAVVARRRRRT